MSVLSCTRSCCENIMCDRGSCKYGYICNECFNELRAMPNIDISEFMRSEKTTVKDYSDWNKIINNEFEVL